MFYAQSGPCRLHISNTITYIYIFLDHFFSLFFFQLKTIMNLKDALYIFSQCVCHLWRERALVSNIVLWTRFRVYFALPAVTRQSLGFCKNKLLKYFAAKLNYSAAQTKMGNRPPADWRFGRWVCCDQLHVSKCSLYVFTVISARLSDPRNFITVHPGNRNRRFCFEALHVE